MCLVMGMNIFENIVITEMRPPVVVPSERGRAVEMRDRPCFGISLCISGQITYTQNGKKYVSNESNAILFPEGANYSLYGDREGFFPVLNFQCENLAVDEITVLPLENPKACIKVFEEIKKAAVSGERLREFGLFYELFDAISRTGNQNRQMENILEYIEKNVQNPALSNPDIAKFAGLSEVYLRRLFLKNCSMTPKQYIINLRIEKAKRMLVETPFTVTGISEECGFSSLYHFCRAFKMRTGATPSQYAKRNRMYQI